MMKQNLRFIFMALLCAVSSMAWGQTSGMIEFGSSTGKVKINSASVTGDDSLENTWTITTVGTTSFTANSDYYQVGSSKAPATSITFTTTLPEAVTITNLEAKFGGYNGTEGTVTLKVGETNVGTGSLSGTSDVTVYCNSVISILGTVLTVTVTDISKGVKCYYIEYTYEVNSNAVKTPTFDPTPNDSEVYPSALSVAINCDTPGATIYFTTDGNDPTASSAVYSTPVSITESGTMLKAMAVHDGMDNSSIASATYTIKPNAPGITANDAKQVTITYDNGLNVYYTIDGTTPTTSSTQYTVPFTPETSCTVKAIAFDTYGNASDIREYSILYPIVPNTNIHPNSNFYVKVTDASTLQDGDAILIVHEDEEAPKAMGAQNTNNRAAAAVTITNHIIQNPSENVKKFILVGTTGAWYFYDENLNGYLYAPGNSNQLKTETRTEEDPSDNAKATISISDGDATIVFQGTNTRNNIRFNPNASNNNPLFNCYASSSDMAKPQIYKEVPIIPVEITNVGYATLYYGEKHLIVPSGVEAYTCVANEDKTITHTKTFVTGDVIPAGTAVLLHGAAGSYSFGESDNASNLTVENMLRGHDVATTTTGPNDATSGYRFYVLSLNAANEASSIGFYYMNAGGAAFESSAHKAYLAVPTSIAGASSYIFDENTGVKSMETEKQCQEGVYTLSGVRMRSEQLPAGIYIVNGKKMVIK